MDDSILAANAPAERESPSQSSDPSKGDVEPTRVQGAAEAPPPLLPVTRLAPPLPADSPAPLRLLRILRRLVEGLYHHDGLSAGPAMAFHFFLSLLPLLVVVGWVLGHVARTRGIEVLFEPIFETAPAAVATIGRRELERLAQTDFTTAPLALVGFLWLASSGVHGMMDAFERALAVPMRRPFWKKRLYSLAFVVFGLMAAALVSFAAVGIESITAPAAPNARDAGVVVDAGSPSAIAPSPTGPVSFVPMPSPEVTRKLRAKINRALAIGCFLVLSVSGVAVFYRFAVEYPKELRRRVWPGAMLAIALWLVISWGFGLYVTSLGQYTLYYGSLAAVAVLLMWFWLTSLALLIGAELNAQLEGSRI